MRQINNSHYLEYLLINLIIRAKEEGIEHLLYGLGVQSTENVENAIKNSKFKNYIFCEFSFLGGLF
jgi:hypothetical protein